MEPTITIVTAVFDVNFGDGQWIQKMLQLNCNLYIITEEKHKDFLLQKSSSTISNGNESNRFQRFALL
jgi:hypothetical protein